MAATSNSLPYQQHISFLHKVSAACPATGIIHVGSLFCRMALEGSVPAISYIGCFKNLLTPAAVNDKDHMLCIAQCLIPKQSLSPSSFGVKEFGIAYASI